MLRLTERQITVLNELVGWAILVALIAIAVFAAVNEYKIRRRR